MITQSVNITYSGTSSVQFNSPVQQTTFLDSTNRRFLRQVMLSNDGLKVIRVNNTIQFPMNQFFAIATQACPSMSWAPIIDVQPSASQFMITSSLPTASLYCHANDEFNTVKYQWYVSASEAGTGWQLPINTTNITFQNTSSTMISASYGSGWMMNTSSFFCVCSNASGQTSSSIGYILPQ